MRQTFRRNILFFSCVLLLFFFVLAKTKIHATKEEAKNDVFLHQTILEADVQISPTENPEFKENRLLPGKPVDLKATLTNRGKKPSVPGVVFVRFGFEGPLESHPQSVIFQTETVSIPSIKEGEEMEILFATKHQYPTLFDYVQDDWAMRKYQVVFSSEDQEYVIGHLALSVSAHYFPLPSNKVVAMVPSYQFEEEMVAANP